MAVKYVALNGPPGSGKSTIARMLTEELQKQYVVKQDSFQAPLKHFIATALGEKFREMNKEKMRPEINGYSVNQFMKHMAVEAQAVYGGDCFARWLVHRILKDPLGVPDFVIIDDWEGILDLMETLDNACMIHVRRDGYGFPRRNEGYCGKPNIVIDNSGSLDALRVFAQEAVGEVVRWSKK